MDKARPFWSLATSTCSQRAPEDSVFRSGFSLGDANFFLGFLDIGRTLFSSRIHMSDVTRILDRAQQGDPRAAEELLPLVYDELRRIAAAKMANETAGQTLQPTALVHEMWLRLGGDTQPNWQSRSHFFAAAGEAMRRILIERARRRQRIRHGGAQERVDFDQIEIAVPEDDERLLAVHDCLDKLALEDPVKADVVKLRFFVGLGEREAAAALGISERTVERHWAYAKVWLLQAIRTQDEN